MDSILFPVLVISGIGLIAGLILAIASVVMSVPKDEKSESILEILPGANCGACGFSGCEGYAKALASGQAKLGLCSPGGQSAINKISKLLGVDAIKSEKKVAVINCCGTNDNTSKKMEYNGIKSCSASNSLFGGNKNCQFGCLGFGDCHNACKYGAITICNGIALVDSYKCTGCGDCIKACPKNFITLVPFKKQAVVYCSSKDKGAKTVKACNSGCIACKQCEKVCNFDAIKIENFLAKVDPEKCTGCGECTKVCKPGCIKLLFH